MHTPQLQRGDECAQHALRYMHGDHAAVHAYMYKERFVTTCALRPCITQDARTAETPVGRPVKKGYTADLSADFLLRSDLSGRRAARRHAAGDAEAVASATARAQSQTASQSVSDSVGPGLGVCSDTAVLCGHDTLERRRGS